MHYHFIAIGGSAMHNLAIALHHKGIQVTGSDDEIFEPSRTRLERLDLLPDKEGWYPDRISQDMEGVILGMHAKGDNPELLRARELNIPVYSYPEFLLDQSVDKQRIVIGGSHGKTTITAIVLHAMKKLDLDTDYMVGAQLEGFDVMVRLTKEAPRMVFEGDEYLTSALDPRPKFHVYKPHIALVSGIAWDHMNVFPTFENYKDQFRKFINIVESGGTLIYCDDDEELRKMVGESDRNDIQLSLYAIPDYIVENGVTRIMSDGRSFPLRLFGRHNMQNIEGARRILEALGVNKNEFYRAIADFKGASKRLEAIAQDKYSAVFRDFAHSPSKLKATVDAVKEQFPSRMLVACMELHTYSSLSPDFLSEYRGCMQNADVPVIYFNPHALKLKKLPDITESQVKDAFQDQRLKVYKDSKALTAFLKSINYENSNLLFMSSGDFNGTDLTDLANEIIRK